MGKKDKDKKKKKKDKKEKKKQKKANRLIEEQVALDEADAADSASILNHIQPSFIEDGARSIRAAHLVVVLESREELINRFDPDGTLGRFREEARLMISLLDDYRTGRYKDVSFWSVAVIVFGFHYVLKPVDIIPDNLPVIGQLDDAMVVAHCIEIVARDLESYRGQSLARDEH